MKGEGKRERNFNWLHELTEAPRPGPEISFVWVLKQAYKSISDNKENILIEFNLIAVFVLKAYY